MKYKNWCEKQGTDDGMTQNHRCKDDGSSYTDPTFYVAAFDEGNLTTHSSELKVRIESNIIKFRATQFVAVMSDNEFKFKGESSRVRNYQHMHTSVFP